MIDKKDFYATNTINGRKRIIESAVNIETLEIKNGLLNRLFGSDKSMNVTSLLDKDSNRSTIRSLAQALKSKAKRVIFPFSTFKNPSKSKNRTKNIHLVESALLNTHAKKGIEKVIGVKANNYKSALIGAVIVAGSGSFVAASVLSLGIVPAIVGSAFTLYAAYATFRAFIKAKSIGRLRNIGAKGLVSTNRNEYLISKLYQISENLNQMNKSALAQPRDANEFKKKMTDIMNKVVDETTGECKQILGDIVKPALLPTNVGPWNFKPNYKPEGDHYSHDNRYKILQSLIDNIENIDVSTILENSVETILQQNNPTQSNPIVSEQVTPQGAIGRQSIASEVSSSAAMSTGESSFTLYNPSITGGDSPRSESSNEDFDPARLALAYGLDKNQDSTNVGGARDADGDSATEQNLDNPSSSTSQRVELARFSTGSELRGASIASTLDSLEFEKRWHDEQQGAPTVLKRGKVEQKDLAALTGKNNKNNTSAFSPRKHLEQSKRNSKNGKIFRA